MSLAFVDSAFANPHAQAAKQLPTKSREKGAASWSFPLVE
jgi:hypothetical protein